MSLLFPRQEPCSLLEEGVIARYHGRDCPSRIGSKWNHERWRDKLRLCHDHCTEIIVIGGYETDEIALKLNLNEKGFIYS